MDEFKLLLNLSSYHVKIISERVIKELKKVDFTMLSGEDSNLKNTWEELCVQVQGEYSFHWDVYEQTVKDFIEEELNKEADAVKMLISYIGSIDAKVKYHDGNDGIRSYIQEYAIEEVLGDIMLNAGFFTNKRIERYLDN